MPTTPSPAACSVPEPVTAPQDAVLITRVDEGAVRYLLATERAGLPSTHEADAIVWLFTLDAFDAEAQLVIAQFVNASWFGIDDVIATVAHVPTTHGAGRAARRRAERGQ